MIPAIASPEPPITRAIVRMRNGLTYERPSFWTEERIEALKIMWADGMSAGQIAAEFRVVTRNAVIGKVFRLKLPARRALVCLPRPKPQSAAAAAPKPSGRRKGIDGGLITKIRKRSRPVAPVEPRLPPPDGDVLAPAPPPAIWIGIPFTRRRIGRDCAFICDSTISADVACCGAPCVAGTEWCAHHLEVVAASPAERAAGRAGAFWLGKGS